MTSHGGVLLLFVLLFIVFAIVLPLWTYSDAQTNSEHSAVLWALVVLFAGIVGLLLYVLLGREKNAGRRRGEAT